MTLIKVKWHVANNLCREPIASSARNFITTWSCAWTNEMLDWIDLFKWQELMHTKRPNAVLNICYLFYNIQTKRHIHLKIPLTLLQSLESLCSGGAYHDQTSSNVNIHLGLEGSPLSWCIKSMILFSHLLSIMLMIHEKNYEILNVWHKTDVTTI